MRKNSTVKLAIPVIAVLLGMVLYQEVYLGFIGDVRSLREQQAVKVATLQKYMVVIAEKPDLEKKIAQLKEKVKNNNAKLIDGEPVSLASANLQETVKGIVTGRRGSISSERIIKAEEAVKHQAVAGNGVIQQVSATKDLLKGKAVAARKSVREDPLNRFKIIGVSIDASLPDPAALSDILYAIETRTPTLVVKELDARVKNFKTPRELMVKIDVAGLYGGK
jgi:hypothetical protein